MPSAPSARTFAQLVGHAHVGMAVVDRTLRLRYANAALAALAQRPPDALVGCALFECLPELRAVAELAVQRVLERGEASSDLTLEGKDPAGEPTWMLATVLPLFDDAEELEAVGLTLVDITAHKRAEEQMREAVRVREEFLSIASHELRTPLTTLELVARRLEVIADSAQDAATTNLRGRTALVRRSVRRLSALVEQLLDVSRLSAGRLDLVPDEHDFVEVVRDTVASLDAGDGRTPPVRLHVPEAAPGTFDALRFEQIVTNLVTNAVKYGGGKAVDVRLFVEPASVRLRVEDQGIGIAPADQRRIFDRFERAVSPRNFNGLGLGLWITRQLVEAMGGRIAVCSNPGEGSTFEVVLPRQPSRSPASAA